MPVDSFPADITAATIQRRTNRLAGHRLRKGVFKAPRQALPTGLLLDETMTAFCMGPRVAVFDVFLGKETAKTVYRQECCFTIRHLVAIVKTNCKSVRTSKDAPLPETTPPTERPSGPLNPGLILAHRLAPRAVSFRAEDAILYALCCGAGADGDLSMVHENGMRVLPSFGQTLCFDDSWMDACGVDLARVVHGGLDLRFAGALVPGAALTVRSTIQGMTDKGEGKAGMILTRSDVMDGDRVVMTSLSNVFVMGGGGFGGSRGDAFEMVRQPDGTPDAVVDVASRPDSPLFFRLLGDLNPLHVRPEVAAKAGFERPIMHGANTFGIACHAIVAGFCCGDPARLKRFAARFSGPLFPGETLTLSIWRGNGGLRFCATSRERGRPVLDGGLAEIG